MVKRTLLLRLSCSGACILSGRIANFRVALRKGKEEQP